MPPQENQSEDDNEILGEIRRRGAPVIKTTIEIDKNLYLKMKEEVARSNSSIRDFLTNAAREKLTHEDKQLDKETSSVSTIERAIQNNTFMKKVLGVLEQEVRPPFNLALLLTKLEDLDIKPEEFSPSDLSDEFLQSLVKPVDALSGPVAAKDLKEALVQLRRG
jgi:hypothetical protein